MYCYRNLVRNSAKNETRILVFIKARYNTQHSLYMYNDDIAHVINLLYEMLASMLGVQSSALGGLVSWFKVRCWDLGFIAAIVKVAYRCFGTCQSVNRMTMYSIFVLQMSWGCHLLNVWWIWVPNARFFCTDKVIYVKSDPLIPNSRTVLQ